MEIHLDDLALYHYETCPYCRKVRNVIDRLGLSIEMRNTREKSEYRDQLMEGGGKNQVPCLRIDRDDDTKWMYESDDIIGFLEHTFG